MGPPQPPRAALCCLQRLPRGGTGRDQLLLCPAGPRGRCIGSPPGVASGDRSPWKQLEQRHPGSPGPGAEQHGPAGVSIPELLPDLSRGLLFPSYWAVDQLLTLSETTAEQQQHQHQCCLCYPLRVLASGPLLLLLLLLSAPAAVLGLLLWLPVQAARRPFAYQHTAVPHRPGPWGLSGPGKAFSFVSANVCLLPDGLAKRSNPGETQTRAARVGQRLTPGDARPDANKVPDGEGEAGTGEISATFPPEADFVCLQEVFDLRATACLRRSLSPRYGHIVYDVGAYGLHGCHALKILNSGLFLASRYPVLAVQYCCYPNGTKADALSAKGLLSVQVQLGTAEGQRTVGYLNCTHLQAPATDAQIRCDQLTMGLQWVQQFQDSHTQPGDVVAFDVFCGDLNFDNCSSGDRLEQTHEIFRQYEDPCRAGPGQDKPWAIGTMLKNREIYNEDVAAPAELKQTLQKKEGRRKYLEGPILPDISPDRSATVGSWEGRRIDYIMYRKQPAPGLATKVEKFSFITQLAGCSDHLAVGLRLLLNPVQQV